MTTVYISIGNSDDKLSQQEWCQYWIAVDNALQMNAHVIHGKWVSPSTDPWQNACWCVELMPDSDSQDLRTALGWTARAYRQDSIAWAETPVTEFLRAPDE